MNIGKLNKRISLITNKVVGGEVILQTIIVWACKKSVKQSEFYASYQVGLNLQMVFEVRTSAYKLSLVTDDTGEKRYAAQVTYDGTTYNIIRTYELDDTVEIVCG